MDRCEECGYVYTDVARGDIAGRIRGFGPRYASLLAGRPDTDLRTRPAPDVWSPLEYLCHIRDVFRAQTERIELALTHDTPDFPSMRREERVTEDVYNEQDPTHVSNEVTHAAEVLASVLEALDGSQWLRDGIYHWPTTEVRTLEWVGRHSIHEGEHHLLDIERRLGR